MARERTFRTEAIILKRSDFGEADRLLTLYTREFGKIRAIAKGARKPQSRKTGHVELFMRSNCFFAKGRDMNLLTQAEMVAPYIELREDLVRTTYAAYGVELLDRFTVDEEHHLELYNLLANALGWFATHEDVRLVARFYELHLLTMAGFRPQFFTCVASGDSIEEEDQFFSAELGGLLSPGNEHADRRAQPITAVAIKVLRYLQTRPWDTVNMLQLKRPLHRELESLMHYYLTYILERNLKSVDFLHRLRHEASLFIDDK
ncbi:MAG: DNA repair protein RecO [Chloroflexi bacterium]|nr:DNA repair protein RecO [Chloroflexota bacterium]